MCATCGCSEPEPMPVAFGRPEAVERHGGPGSTLRVEQEILSRNADAAAENRAWLRGRSVLALNLASSPGSGKTTLVVRTIRDLAGRLPISVVEGDQATSRDADRVRAAGAPALQINTGTACHLDALGVGRALADLDPPAGSCVMIENVGNLICPAMFDLGEAARVVVASTTEGEDKPLKYPHMFRSADAVLLNKIDLLPHLAFDPDRFAAFVREVNPRARLIPVSALRGDGLDAWYEWVLSLARGGRA